MLKVLGIITARGGSKGIPRKNIKDLEGRPLIAYTIVAAKKSKLLTRCILSTDDEEITTVAKDYGCEVPFMRPQEFAQDTSTSIEVVQHAIKWIKDNEKKEYDYVMILQPTSPMRTAEDIDNAIMIAEETGADSVMSMKELVDMSAKKLKKIDEKGRILPYYEDEGKTSAMRQDLAKVYKRNCAIYLTKTPLIMSGDLFGRDSRAYIMPEERSVDINKPVDFEMAEFWMMKKLGKL
jgi:CMP-N-acetylneuraminic acid synthetase